jgi:uncharacterized protein (DUF736 family)
MDEITNRRRTAFAANGGTVVSNLSIVARTPNQIRQHLMRRIGVFEEIDGEFVGHIATLNFKCEATIRENPYRTCSAEPDWIVVAGKEAAVFHPDLGYAWNKHTDGNNVAYKEVHLDDPAFPKTIVAVLIKGAKNFHYLFWDRVTVTDDDIERQFVTEELTAYVGVLRPIDKVTDYLLSIYPSLAEDLDAD